MRGTSETKIWTRTLCASGVALALSVGGTVAAQQAESQQQTEQARVAAAERDDEKQARWEDMREQYINAADLLEADVTNDLNTVGNVSNLVLSSDGSRIEYVLVDASYPYIRSNQPGFVVFEEIELADTPDARVSIDFSADVMQAPDELELTSAEADHRLATRLIDSEMYFADDDTYTIKDLIVDRETGEIAHYVVSTDTSTLFDLDRITVPADQVDVGEGGTLEASMPRSAAREAEQEFDEEFLY